MESSFWNRVFLPLDEHVRVLVRSGAQTWREVWQGAANTGLKGQEVVSSQGQDQVPH